MDINVASYGAQGVGGDDTAAIQAACAAATPADRLIFGPGRFGLSRTITPPCRIKGAHRTLSTVFALPGTGIATQPLVDFIDKNDVGLSSIALEGAGEYASGQSSGTVGAVRFGASLAEGGDFVLRDAALRNFKVDYWILGAATKTFSRGRIERCLFDTKVGDAPVYGDNQAGGGYLTALYGSTTGTMMNTVVEDNDVSGIGVAIGFFLVNSHRNFSVSRNRISSMGQATTSGQNSYPICVYGYDDNYLPAIGRIDDNIIVSPASCGIYCATAQIINASNNVIVGQSRVDDASLPRAGIAMNGIDRFLVEGNNLDSCWGGVAVTNGSDGDVIGNRIMSFAGGNPYGIRLDGTFADTVRFSVLANDICLRSTGSTAFRVGATGGRISIRENPSMASVMGIADAATANRSFANNPFMPF